MILRPRTECREGGRMVYWIRKIVLRTLDIASMVLSKALIAGIGLFFAGVGVSLIPKYQTYSLLNKIVLFDAQLRAPLMKWMHANLPFKFEGFDAAPWIYITTLFLSLVVIEFYRDRNFEQREVLTMKRKSELEKKNAIKQKLEKQKKLKAELAMLEAQAAAREVEQEKIRKEQEALYKAQRDAIAAAQRASQERAAKERAEREAADAERRAAETAKQEAAAELAANEAAKREAEALANQSAGADKEAIEAAKREADEIKRKAHEAAEAAKREAAEAEKRAEAAKREALESERRAQEAKRAEAEAKAREAADAKAREEAEKAAPAESAQSKREELMELLAQTKKSLDEQKRHLAFLAMDVVNSTGMKQGEDPAIAARDFRQYKKHVMSALQKHGYLKLAWTPDGQMICFPTVEAAIKAGQDVLTGLEKFNREIKAMKMDFRLRAGINAGRVLYDEDIPMEEMSDRVIDITGHMQKYAPADSIFITEEALGDRAAEFKFAPVEKVVDGCKVLCWKAPSAEDDLKPDAVAA